VNAVLLVFLTYISALVGFLRKIVTSVHGSEQDKLTSMYFMVTPCINNTDTFYYQRYVHQLVIKSVHLYVFQPPRPSTWGWGKGVNIIQFGRFEYFILFIIIKTLL